MGRPRGHWVECAAHMFCRGAGLSPARGPVLRVTTPTLYPLSCLSHAVLVQCSPELLERKRLRSFRTEVETRAPQMAVSVSPGFACSVPAERQSSDGNGAFVQLQFVPHSGGRRFKLRHFLQDNETLSTFLLKNASFSEHDVQQIRDADVSLEKVLLKGFGVHLRDMCPRNGGKRSVEDFVTISDPKVSMLAQEVICRAPPVWLDRAEEHFLSNLDFLKPIQFNVSTATGTEILKIPQSEKKTAVYRFTEVKGGSFSDV
ncbi:uncharacterized protein LOC121938690 [Plectropomus leopardus]|uniref:uncharacterized protein LOC121938690 n=1 Tax=Plectropomus leopardus TaxID=160734 RepID=UPI001C4D766E|nr:uncharacterized protein LOC121938690 [Plectropomus leopardus]